MGKLIQNDGSSVTPDFVENESYDNDLRSKSENENDHWDTDSESSVSITLKDQINDPSIPSKRDLSPSILSGLKKGAKNRVDCYGEDKKLLHLTKKIEVGLDSNKIDHPQNYVVEETKMLEDDHRIAEARVEEEASLLFEKWLEDDRKIDQAPADLEDQKISESQRIESES